MKILVVEDNPSVSRALTRVLTRFLKGATIILAGNGVEMAQAFLDHGTFDLVTMDGRLDYMRDGATMADHGPDLIRKIRTTFDSKAPILFISAEGPDVFQQALEAGATECLKKPYEVGDLALILQNLQDQGLLPRT